MESRPKAQPRTLRQYYATVWTWAWKATKPWVGSRLAQWFLLLSFVVGLAVYAQWVGWGAAAGEIQRWIYFGLVGPICVWFIVFMVYLVKAPYERHCRLLNEVDSLKQKLAAKTTRQQWLEMNEKFNEVTPSKYHPLRLNYQRESRPSSVIWTLQGGGGHAADRFAATARMAGQLLRSSRSARSELPEDIIGHAHDDERWYFALKHLKSSKFQGGPMLVVEDRRIAISHLESPHEVSATLCQEFASKETG